MPALSQSEGLGERVEKLRLRPVAVKNPNGFPGGHPAFGGGDSPNLFTAFSCQYLLSGVQTRCREDGFCGNYPL